MNLRRRDHRRTAVGLAWVAASVIVLGLCLIPSPLRAQIPSSKPLVDTGTEDRSPSEAGSATARQESAPTNAQERSDQGLVREVGIETFYVRDAKGELVPVPNMTYEEFVRLYELDRELTNPEQPPRFSLEEMKMVATIENDRAAIDVTFQVNLLIDGTVRVPLRLPQAVLSRTASFDSKGDHVLLAEPGRGGYACWLRGKAGTSHTIRLKLIASVMKVGGES